MMKNSGQVDHFDEICAKHNQMTAGAAKDRVPEISNKAWEYQD